MPEKPSNRPVSASRKRRRANNRQRRHSFNANSNPPEALFNPNESPEIDGAYFGVDLRSTKEKIEHLENELKQHKDDLAFEEQLNFFVLLQLYNRLEYGEKSYENIRAYLNLSQFYFNDKKYISQAKTHIQTARDIIEQLNIENQTDHLIPNLLAFEVYLLFIKCSSYTKQYLSQRDSKTRRKPIDHDLDIIDEYLEKLKPLMSTKDYDKRDLDYLSVKFDLITNNTDEYNHKIFPIVDEIINIMEKFPSDDDIKRKIDIYLRLAMYLCHFDDNIQEGFKYFQTTVGLAEKEEEKESNDEHKYQLANALYQWGKAKVRANRLTDNTERKLQRAIKLYRQVNEQDDKDIMKILDELAIFYTKTKRYEDALDILCKSLDDKKRLFGDFSDEVIQTESQIGAIYLCEGEYLNAAEHLKECLFLQEFVYGPNDSRTRQTRSAVEILKKNPKVSQSLFTRTQDTTRPAFRLSNKVSYEKEDNQLLLTVTKKPPVSSRN